MLRDGRVIECGSCGAELYECLNTKGLNMLGCLNCGKAFLLDASGQLVPYEAVFPDPEPRPLTNQEKEDFNRRLKPYKN